MFKDTNLSVRDYIAIEMSKTVPPPTEYVGDRETEKFYKDWANKCYKMADTLIKRGDIR